MFTDMYVCMNSLFETWNKSFWKKSLLFDLFINRVYII